VKTVQKNAKTNYSDPKKQLITALLHL